jgi:hypothetical protein
MKNRHVMSAVACAIVLVALGGGAAYGDNLIANKNSALCLSSDSSTSGSDVVQHYCSLGDPAQIWFVADYTTVSGVVYYQLEDYLGLCLAVDGASTSGGAHIVHKTCGNVANNHAEGWTPVSVTNSNGIIFMLWKNGHSGKCFGVQSSSTSDGALIVQGSDCAVTDARTWTANVP